MNIVFIYLTSDALNFVVNTVVGIKILDALEKEIKIFHRLCLRTMGHRVELFLDILRTSVIKWSSQPSTIAAAF